MKRISTTWWWTSQPLEMTILKPESPPLSSRGQKWFKRTTYQGAVHCCTSSHLKLFYSAFWGWTFMKISPKILKLKVAFFEFQIVSCFSDLIFKTWFFFNMFYTLALCLTLFSLEFTKVKSCAVWYFHNKVFIYIFKLVWNIFFHWCDNTKTEPNWKLLSKVSLNNFCNKNKK